MSQEKETDGINTFMGCLGVLVYIPLVTVLIYLLNGWVGSSLWNWFIVPTFHTVSLTWQQAVGVSCVLAFWTK